MSINYVHWTHSLLSYWHFSFLSEPQDDLAMHICLFGGDRLSCCDGAVAAMNDDNLVVGVASYSKHGEGYSGRPSIIGCWVHPVFRRQGIGMELLRMATAKLCVVKPEIVPVSESGRGLVNKFFKGR